MKMCKRLLKYVFPDVKFVRRFIGGTWYLQHNDVIGYWWDQELSKPRSCGHRVIITEIY